MIQDIHPHCYNTGFQKRLPTDGDYVIALRGGKVLLRERQGMTGIPDFAFMKTFCPDAAACVIYLFSLDSSGFYLYMGEELDEPAGFAYQDIMSFREYQPQWLAFGGVTASHLGLWYGKNRFCGCCGEAMLPKEDERALRCSDCGEVMYPRISPAVIVAVVDGDRLLMTRYANRPGARMALVAGFMEVGETLEDTVRREVMEEVGVGIKNIRYYKSQPWAFSGSVLVGFFADLDGGADITMDTVELQEATWLERHEIPDNPSTVSLTAEMVKVFREGRVPECRPAT